MDKKQIGNSLLFSFAKKEVLGIAKYNVDYDIRAPTGRSVFYCRNKSVPKKSIYFSIKADTGGKVQKR